VALIEILVGVAAGNLHFRDGQQLLHSTDWTNFLAMLGSGVLTFLAGAEIDPVSLRANLRASMAIGTAAFLLPFLGVWLFVQFGLGWPLHQALIAGIALSTTSVAVVYAVMIETRQSETPLGKMILAACFINDLGTVLALGLIFANFNLWLLVFVVVTCVMLWFMPKWTEFIVVRTGFHRQKRGRLAGLSHRPGCGGGVPARQDAGASDAEHRLRRVHAVLLHSRRLVRVAAGALDRAGGHRCLAAAQDGDQVHRRAPLVADVLHARA
jgi:hypothetical protein